MIDLIFVAQILLFFYFTTQIFVFTLPQAACANMLVQKCIQLQIKG